MGFRIAWLAFNKRKDGVLTALHVVDTGEPDEANESPMSVASFPDGWTLVWLERFDHPFTDDASLRLFSQDCTVIAAHVHEGTMFSSSECYRNGAALWSAFHDSQQGLYHIETEGDLPGAFSSIVTELKAQQDAAGGEKANVDYMFDVPLALAKSICGFQHDRWKYEWGEPEFTILHDRSKMQ